MDKLLSRREGQGCIYCLKVVTQLPRMLFVQRLFSHTKVAWWW